MKTPTELKLFNENADLRKKLAEANTEVEKSLSALNACKKVVALLMELLIAIKPRLSYRDKKALDNLNEKIKDIIE